MKPNLVSAAAVAVLLVLQALVGIVPVAAADSVVPQRLCPRWPDHANWLAARGLSTWCHLQSRAVPDPSLVSESVGFVAVPHGRSGFHFWVLPTAPNGTFSLPTSINDRGQIVGIIAGTHSGFLYSGGRFQTIDYPGADLTAPNGINNAGLIVGEYASPSAPSLSAFTYQMGTFKALLVPGSTESIAYGVNNQDEIVGSFVLPDAVFGFATHAFLATNAVFSTFAVPDSQVTIFTGINDRKKVVGSFVNNTGVSSPFLYESGVTTPIVIPNAFSAGAQSINNSDQIVGNYAVWDDIEGVLTSHAYLYSDGTVANIEFPGKPGKIIDVTTTVTGINTWGQIVGIASYTRVRRR